ncbi:hypothetical protein [Altericista sp. CCNU0014]|uniref:hypothetical protein n=1 Tax=Altericista sp. CCNU0014 TaxID=3082949 RepID=UPI00384BEC1A
MTQLSMAKFRGRSYVNLPKNLCPGYTDLLLGRTDKQKEYGGVICDRPEASYILLQRLLRHTDRGQAVWQIVQVQSVLKPNPQSLVLGVGCQQHLRRTASSEPIFALVQPTAKKTYKTLAAWKVSLARETFIALEPQKVVCEDILL